MSNRLARILVADPPWKFGDSLPKGRGAENKYPCMDLTDIATYPHVPRMAPAGSILLLWTVAAMPAEALTVCRAWGYEKKAEMIWAKTTKDGSGLRLGMGRTVRNVHETVWICTRGKTPEIQDMGVPSIFYAPRSVHSEKPAAFYDLVEKLWDGPYVELFGRFTDRENWSQPLLNHRPLPLDDNLLDEYKARRRSLDAMFQTAQEERTTIAAKEGE